jgi:hypothetical protein
MSLDTEWDGKGNMEASSDVVLHSRINVIQLPTLNFVQVLISLLLFL